MRPIRLSIALTVFASIGFCFAARLSDRVLLVVNDASPVSVTIGEDYVRLRRLPPENVCRLETSTAASVDRSTYESEIRNPLGDWLSAHDLQDRILYIVTTDGLPLWIRGDGGPVGDLASVDSELTLLYRHLLGRDEPVLGRVANPYFAPFTEGNRFPVFRRDQQDIYLVTRLFAHTSGRAATEPVSGDAAVGVFAIDLRSRHQTFLQDWASQARSLLQAQEQTVVSSEIGVPLEVIAPLAGYCGNLDAQTEFSWSPGAIAVLFGDTWKGLDCHSGVGSRETGVQAPEASKLGTRNPEPGTSSRDCPENTALELLTQGVAGVVFNVADPTTDGSARPQILFPAYVSGRDLAESVYLATRYLSWRQVVAGDPLTAISSPPTTRPEWTGARDPATGGPKLFAERRREALRDRYATSDEVITLLMKAEFAEAHDQPEQALGLVEQSLKLDPSVWDANWLRARLLDRLARYEEAYAGYQKALDLASKARFGSAPALDETALQWKLARLAMTNLHRADLAAPHAQWLLDHRGIQDLDVVKLWSQVKLKLQSWDEAESVLLRLARQNDQPPAFVLEGLGEVSQARGDRETAERYFHRALEAEGADKTEIEAKLQSLTPATTEPSPDTGDEATTSVNETWAPSADDEISELTHPARIVSRSPVEYPEQAVREGIEGIVSLRLLVDERGQLVHVERVRGNPILAKGAERGVHTWTFEPKLVNGRPETDWIEVAIQFEMKKK